MLSRCSAPVPVTASRAPAAPPKKGTERKRRMSSREVIAAAELKEEGSRRLRRVNCLPRCPALHPPPRTKSKSGSCRRRGRGKARSRSVAAETPEIKLKVSTDERPYRRFTADRYRRASVFNEIIAEQQREALEKGNAHKSHHSRVGMIQGTAHMGVDTAHRSRLMAFEQVAHSGNDDEYVINPYCVAAMPEPIRKAFVTKVLGIVSFQMMLMVSIICIIKYTD